MESTRIVGIVALYKPIKEDIVNIQKYIDRLDYCLLMDDTGVDNKELFEEFLKNHTNVEYINNVQNIGLCKSVNRGFAKAKEMGAEWALVMNPDGTFQNDALKVFRSFIAKNDCERVAIISPKYNFDRHHAQPGKGARKIRYADMTGCLYNMKILDKLGYYDENTYFYGLDVEYCLRVLKNGYSIVECSKAVLNHHPAETKELRIGKISLKYGWDSSLKYYYRVRSGSYIFRKYHDFRSAKFMILKYFKALFLFENKKEYLKMMHQGLVDSKRGYFGSYQNR